VEKRSLSPPEEGIFSIRTEKEQQEEVQPEEVYGT
jgi:hypothetical protein